MMATTDENQRRGETVTTRNTTIWTWQRTFHFREVYILNQASAMKSGKVGRFQRNKNGIVVDHTRLTIMWNDGNGSSIIILPRIQSKHFPGGKENEIKENFIQSKSHLWKLVESESITYKSSRELMYMYAYRKYVSTGISVQNEQNAGAKNQ